MKTQTMLASHPQPADHADLRTACIEACLACVQCCSSCADACLMEDDPKAMAGCIRSDLDCADICAALACVLSRQTEPNCDVTKALISTCQQCCKVCGEICSSHASKHEHCRVCAECCKTCESACDRLLHADKENVKRN